MSEALRNFIKVEIVVPQFPNLPASTFPILSLSTEYYQPGEDEVRFGQDLAWLAIEAGILRDPIVQQLGAPAAILLYGIFEGDAGSLINNDLPSEQTPSRMLIAATFFEVLAEAEN